MSRILIVEDEPHIVRFLAKGLHAQGHSTASAPDGQSALHMARTGEFDLMLLDLGLPKLDGSSVLSELRRQQVRLPIIVLTARSSADDIVTSLDGGADDYLTKPFRLAELLARVRARLRPAHAQEQFVLAHGTLSLDLRTRQAQVGRRTIDLSAREFALLEVFLRHPGQVLSREQLLSHVWGYDYDPSSNVVDVYVRYLRNKIGPDRIATGVAPGTGCCVSLPPADPESAWADSLPGLAGPASGPHRTRADRAPCTGSVMTSGLAGGSPASPEAVGETVRSRRPRPRPRHRRAAGPSSGPETCRAYDRAPARILGCYFPLAP